MATGTHYPHLVFDADGTVRVGKTRYKVKQLAGEHYQFGWTTEELLRQHPDLRPEEVYASLTYYYDHFDSIVAELKASAATHDATRSPQPFSREELLRRREGKAG
jgi:uncharacterized protein (DUF433 family)